MRKSSIHDPHQSGGRLVKVEHQGVRDDRDGDVHSLCLSSRYAPIARVSDDGVTEQGEGYESVELSEGISPSGIRSRV